MNEEELKLKANWLRRTILEMAVKGKSGHVTTAFSLSELIVAFYYGNILRYEPSNPKWEGRDRFILSAGQAGIGVYPVLGDVGFFPVSELDNFLGEGSTLGVHAESTTPGIEILSGSLGHGLPVATGMADSAKLDGKDWLVFCLTGDGELFEGSNWEALLTASRFKLDNLVLVVNRNRQFVIGYTDRDEKQCDVILDPVKDKLESFGCEVRCVENGHSFGQIFDAFANIRERKSEKPLAIIVDTVKGQGSKVMAGVRGWHYRVPIGEELEQAREELRLESEMLSRKEEFQAL